MNDLQATPIASITQAVPFSRFREDVEAVYGLRAKKTLAKVRQVMREVAELQDARGRPLVRSTSDLRPAVIARWRTDHPDRAPATVHSLMRSLRSACTVGVASGYMAVSPLNLKALWPDVGRDEDVERHHPIAAVGRVLTRLRDDLIFSWHAHRLFVLAATVALTGVRKMEALNLMVRDCDFDLGCIRISSRRKLKTKASAAPVGMPKELAAIIREWLPHVASPWLIPQVGRKGPWTGGPPGQKPLDKLKAAGLAVGVEGFTFQSLRHSWATHGEFWGLGETMIQRQLRHTSLRTQQAYRHADARNLAVSVAGISYGLTDPSVN